MFLYVPAPWEQLLIWLNLHWVGIEVGLLLFKTSYNYSYGSYSYLFHNVIGSEYGELSQ